MIAGLPMYDRAETRAANDRLWAAIRARLGHGPAHLDRESDVWTLWRNPELVLAQTCGMPYRTRLHGKVALVGTPDHRLADCPAGYYNSVLVTRRGDSGAVEAYAGRRLAYNEAGSQSGWAAPQTHAAGLGFTFSLLLHSGAHRESARAVAEERADIAALDAVSWELIRRFDGFAAGLQEIGRTEPTPALPYIAAAGSERDAVFRAVSVGIDALAEEDRTLLCLHGLVAIPDEAYLAVPTPPGPDVA
jgi:ABC-type phosphate/phosphonate transport system substrate-binding protein